MLESSYGLQNVILPSPCLWRRVFVAPPAVDAVVVRCLLFRQSPEMNQSNLQKAWNIKQVTTREDWEEWIRRFSVELLRESPNLALRACSALAQVGLRYVCASCFSSYFRCFFLVGGMIVALLRHDVVCIKVTYGGGDRCIGREYSCVFFDNPCMSVLSPNRGCACLSGSYGFSASAVLCLASQRVRRAFVALEVHYCCSV